MSVMIVLLGVECKIPQEVIRLAREEFKGTGKK